jgi:hypothetical protein
MLPSIMQDNFLDDFEIELVQKIIYEKNNAYDDIRDNVLRSRYYTWSFYNKDYAVIKDIFTEKLKKTTGINLIVNHSHILDSFIPYTIHTDYYQEKPVGKNLEPAYTMIIPLDNYNSNTIVFNQFSEIKSFESYIDNKNSLIISDSNRIPKETVDQYLTHLPENFVNYLSLKEIFHWKKGSAHFCDRRYFHCSDNYNRNNLTGKKAIIFWCSTISKT